MVRGVSDDFWATFVDPDPTQPKKRAMTVWGQGAVNVNGEPLTLLGLICSAAKPGVAPAASASSSASSAATTPPPYTAPAATSSPAAGVNPNMPAMCTDPNQTALFTMAITMAKGISMGAPIFGTTQDFIAAVKGQGMLGPMLAMLGLQPVAFQSESEFAKAITTESKMFSIYAVGVVKGYKRETRLSLHEVVDFRTAPTVTQSALPTGTGTPGTPGLQQPGNPTVQAPPAASGQPDANAMAAAMQPSTGGPGRVLSHRVEEP